MDTEVIDNISAMADRAQSNADRARANSERLKTAAGYQAEKGDFAKAEKYRRQSASYLNDYFFWKGQSVALAGVAAGLGLREVVEEEADSEPICP